MPHEIDCVTVEFLRLGGDEGILATTNQYIRTAGYDQTVSQISAGLSHRDFRIRLERLRYRRETTAEQVAEATEFLAARAAGFLQDELLGTTTRLRQIDIVTSAAELWAFPFEAWLAQHPDALASAESGVVITRRIRANFSSVAPPWPDVPKILFAHAPEARDLEPELIAAHKGALCTALLPWAAGGDPEKKGLLTVSEVRSASDLAEAMKGSRHSFVHILAHGAEIRGVVREDDTWGLRLGSPAAAATDPVAIADVLRPMNGCPVVVTIAACDSGNQDAPAMGHYSVAQELHRRGVPVVVASQLPLTKPGSVEFARAFYCPLLEGGDVRAALHAGRVAVRKSPDAAHDWLSVVAYTRLPPEGYELHLLEFRLRAQLGMLRALQEEVEGLILHGGTEERFLQVERQYENRIEALQRLRAQLDRKNESLRQECGGLLASASKRQAELLFMRAQCLHARRAQDLADSKTVLARSLEAYRETFRALPQSHWNGIQQLALETVLTGRIAVPSDWELVYGFAKALRDSQPDEYWASGTLVEALLLAPFVGKPRDLAAVRAEVETLRARAAGNSFAVESTRRQIKRYETWWTTENGYFPGVADLVGDAKAVGALLA